jgi:hypothetical protein
LQAGTFLATHKSAEKNEWAWCQALVFKYLPGKARGVTSSCVMKFSLQWKRSKWALVSGLDMRLEGSDGELLQLIKRPRKVALTLA